MDSRQQMSSLGGSCNELKNQYDNCFNTWFSEKFLKGDTNDSMSSIEVSMMEPCKDLKQKYDSCFNTWFSEKFLKGDHNDAVCAPLLKVYKECVQKAIKDQHIELHDVQANHLETDKEKLPQS